jgi:hypothetical protein
MASVIDVCIYMEHWWNDTDNGKPNFRRKSCPGAMFCTTNSTLTGLGMKLAND